MCELIAERDDTPVGGNAADQIRRNSAKLAEGFADDLELPLDSRAEHRVRLILGNDPSCDKAFYVLRGPIASSEYTRRSRGMQRPPRAVDRFPQIRVVDGVPLQEIDAPAQNILQRVQEAEIRIRVFGRRQGRESHEKVEVTSRGIEVPDSGRSEEREGHCALTLRKSDDLGGPLLEQLGKRHHGDQS